MKKINYLKQYLMLLVMLMAVTSAWGDDYELVTEAPTDWSGDYVVVSALAQSASTFIADGSVTGNSFSTANGVKTLTTAGITYNSTTKKLSGVTNSYVLHIAPSSNSGKYYITLKGASSTIYLIGNSTTGSSSISSATVTTNADWSLSLGKGGNAYLVGKSGRYVGWNSSYFRAYASSNKDTYKAYLFKKSEVNATALSVNHSFNKKQYKITEALDTAGLQLTATTANGDITVNSDYILKIGNDTIKHGDALNSFGEKVLTICYGGQTTTDTIYVGTLDEISLNTTNVKTTYNVGETFNPANLTVNATFRWDKGEDEYWEEPVSGYTISPDGALTAADDKVTITYIWNEVEKTADIPLTMNAKSAYTVTFNAGTGTCATASLTETAIDAGVTLPTATPANGWTFAGWAESEVTKTNQAPTLFDATTTYHPVDNITLYAVYKYVNAETGQYYHATTIDEITSSDHIAIIQHVSNKYLLVNNEGNVTWSDAPEDEIITPIAGSIFAFSGNNTDGFTISNTNGAIGTSALTGSGNITVGGTYNTWIVEETAFNPNTFVLRTNNATTMEYYSYAWKTYTNNNYNTTDGEAYALRIYIPLPTYNSNPVALITPTIAFANTDDKTIYVQNENEYTNVATVTGIDKPVAYTSSNSSIATVDQNGKVTAVSKGEATITAMVEAENGVNAGASTSYKVIVKDASNIAGIKELTSTSTVKSFTADLTNAVVTYVKDNYAYIQDESASVFVNFENHGLIAGKKINGAISGKVKASNQIDQITELNLTDAVVGDSVVPAAPVVTLSQIIAGGTAYDEMRVVVNGATVTSAVTIGVKGGQISDDNKVTYMDIFAEDANIEIGEDAITNLTGFISIYKPSANSSPTYRFNLYEQSQVQLIQNAPIDQPMTFDNDEITLEEATEEVTAFTGQTVSGNVGTVTYAISGDNIGTINTTTGVVTLNGTCGTATVTATAAADTIVENSIPTPYNETAKEYTITVYSRHTVTFSINGHETVLRQEHHGDAINVPVVEFFGSKVFVGWGTSANDSTFIKLGETYTPTEDKTFYALFATATESTEAPEEVLSQTLLYDTWTFGGSTESKSSTYRLLHEGGYIESAEFDLSTLSKVIVYGRSYGGDSYNRLSIGDGTNVWKNVTVSGSSNTSPNTFTNGTALNGIGKLRITSTCGGTSNGVRVTKIEIYTTPSAITYSDFTSTIGTDNIVVDGEAEKIDLTDVNDFELPENENIHAEEVTYERKMGKLSTIYLPYDTEIPTGMKAYQFEGINSSNTALSFTEVNTLEAYTPYVLEQATADTDEDKTTLSNTNVNIAGDAHHKTIVGEWTFQGTAKEMTNAEVLTTAGTGTAYIINNSEWHPVVSNAAVTIPAFRAYFICTESNGAKVMDTMLDGKTTKIELIGNDAQKSTRVYTMDGRYIGTEIDVNKKNVFVVNGKKFMNK